MDGFIDDPVFGSDLIGARFCKVRHPGIVVAEVYLGEALIEEDFGRIEFELESQLFVIARDRQASVIKQTCLIPQVPKSRECAGDRTGHFSGIGYSHCLVSSQIQQRVLKVPEGEVKPLQQEIGDTTLEVCNGQILVGFCCELEMPDRSLVVAYGGVDEAHVREDF